MRIIFMGTPDFAVPSLNRIYADNHEILLVVTRPDTKKGRGLKIGASEVKVAAETLGLPVEEPESLKDPDFIAKLRGLTPDLIVVVAFRILPQEILSIPKFGAVNIHASLLPKYRGAAPIQWAIAKGETETGVTLFFLNQTVDGGAVIAQAKTAILETETAGELRDRLKELGADLLSRSMEKIAAGSAGHSVQDEASATPAPKIRKEDGRINFAKSAREIYNLIRAFTPVPGAFGMLQGKRLQLASASWSDEICRKPAGMVVQVGKDHFSVATGSGILSIASVKPENRNAMAVRDFLNGSGLKEGDQFNA